MQQLIIDRIEDNTAHLEDNDGSITQLPAAWLPTDAAEGHVIDLILTTEPHSSSITLRINPTATRERIEDAQNLRAQLRKGPEGDIDL